MMKQFKDGAAIDFANLGNEFADAANVLYKACQGQHAHLSWPVHFTTCQALELYLKAFLRANEVSLPHLRKTIGHDLERALRESKHNGLGKFVTVADVEEHVIKILNTHYKNRDFQYKGSGEFTLAPVGCLIPLLDRMRGPLMSVCAGANEAGCELHISGSGSITAIASSNH
ncbi:MAG TPA: hypothetical protein VMF08_04735 [Candidatus Sulfotelmatobacter sp.]|nr:hypothetical protein [Candidatus Sulfotelmatobacter sp.]